MHKPVKYLSRVAVITLVLCMAPSYAASTASKHYFKVVESADSSTAMYIGATQGYLPIKTASGDVLIRALAVQLIARNGVGKGAEDEYVLLASCDKQTIKVLPIWHLPYTGGTPTSRFPGLTGEKLATAIVDTLDKAEIQYITPDTPVAAVVDVGCSYVEGPPTVKPSSKPTTPGIEI